MTAFVPSPLLLTWSESAPGVLRLSLKGDLDYATAGALLDQVTDRLDQPGLRDVRLDCSGLGVCDSMGLSVFLLLHRRVTGVGARLHLDARPQSLDRMLDMTGTLEHLTGRTEDAAGRQEERQDERS